MTEKQGVVARWSDPVGTAPIYIRITEGREAAFKMATGHGVLLCEWGRRLQMQLLHYE
jgi:hypothetical protein